MTRSGVHRTGAAVLCALAAALVAVPPAGSVPNDADGDPVVAGRCKPSTYTLAARMAVVGLPLARSTVEIDAESAKLIAVGIQDGCDQVYAKIPRFRWSVVSTPRRQRATLSGTGTLSPGVSLGGPGSYRIRLTACPSGCTVTVPGFGSRRVEASSQDVTIAAVDSIVLPPETDPIRPPLSSTEPTDFSRRTPDAEDQCLGGGGVIDPQWVTVNRFNGPGDYEFAEGRVDKSRISSMDNFLNHESQDHIIALNPDSPYRRLLSTKPEFGNRSLLGIEWEVDHFPRVFRPTAGDRASVFGFWILDCGHSFYTEIHPPVGIAVERPRPVRIPTSFRSAGFPNGFGSNVLVPGIVTDLYFSRRSGETTSNCSDTGLHQPPERPFFAAGDCIREPHSLDRRFAFRIYLPRSPQARLQQEVGVSAPPVPLYTAVRGPREGSSGGGPDPAIRVVEQDGIAFLEVEVDLRGFSGGVYARRIEAAWAYAASDNWDARRWRVRLDTMDVSNDAEPPGDDGDWRVFFNTNNTHREWTQIMNCNGCVDDDETIELDLSTGRQLGDDPIVFPDQDIMVHTTGYDDEVSGDSTGEVINPVPQELAQARCRRNRCRHSADSLGGGGAYELNYTLRRGPSLGRAALTQEARNLFEAYRLRGEQPCARPRPRCVPAPGTDAAQAQDWHPENQPLRGRGLFGRRFALFEPQESERFALTGITTRELRRLLARARTRNRRRLARFLSQMRVEIRALPRAQRRDLYPLVYALDRALPRKSFIRALPRGFRPSKLKRFNLSERRAEEEPRRR